MRNTILKMMLPVAAVMGLVASAPVAAAEDIGRQMEREYGVVGRNSYEGRRMNDQFDRVVDRIVHAVNQDRRSGNFRLKSAKILGGRSEKHDRVINAFALPDGRIYVTRGLIEALRDSPRQEDELAFVVAHEVTHVSERHSANQQKKAMGAGLAALLLGAVTKNRTLGNIAGLGANAYVSHYSRTDEYRADKGGLLAMHRAGYDPDAAATMLKRLEAKGESRNGFINGLFGSHPLTQNRVNRVREMSRNLERGRAIDTDVDADDDDDRRPRQRRRNR